MADLELCAAISDAFGPSGYEKEAVDVIESSLGDWPHTATACRTCMSLCRRMWADVRW